jgi:uncharacterized protein (UPF0335 family)
MVKEHLKELVERLTVIENEIKLLQDDRKNLISDFGDKLDVKAFRAAWSILKTKKRVDEGALEQILNEIDRA